MIRVHQFIGSSVHRFLLIGLGNHPWCVEPAEPKTEEPNNRRTEERVFDAL